MEPKTVQPRSWVLPSDEWFESLEVLSRLVLKDER